MSKFAKPAHKRAARMLGYALTLGAEADWRMFAALINRLLTDREKSALAYSAIMALDERQAQITAEAAMGDAGAGMPQAAFLSAMNEASFWADLASDEELDAYCLATFNRMAPGRQALFLAHVQEWAA